jgi:hypothetical protein
MSPNIQRQLNEIAVRLARLRHSLLPKKSANWLGWTDLGLKIVVAVVGGYWAFSRFGDEDVPALEHRARITGDITWQKWSDTHCIGWYTIKFENIGKRSIKLSGVKVQGWELAMPGTDQSVSYIDPLALEGSAEIVAASPVKHLAQYYAPGVSDEHSMMLFVKRTPRRMVVFKVIGHSELTGRSLRLRLFGGDLKQEDDWYDYRIDEACIERPDPERKPSKVDAPR